MSWLVRKSAMKYAKHVLITHYPGGSEVTMECPYCQKAVMIKLADIVLQNFKIVCGFCSNQMKVSLL